MVSEIRRAYAKQYPGISSFQAESACTEETIISLRTIGRVLIEVAMLNLWSDDGPIRFTCRGRDVAIPSLVVALRAQALHEIPAAPCSKHRNR